MNDMNKVKEFISEEEAIIIATNKEYTKFMSMAEIVQNKDKITRWMLNFYDTTGPYLAGTYSSILYDKKEVIGLEEFLKLEKGNREELLIVIDNLIDVYLSLDTTTERPQNNFSEYTLDMLKNVTQGLIELIVDTLYYNNN